MVAELWLLRIHGNEPKSEIEQEIYNLNAGPEHLNVEEKSPAQDIEEGQNEMKKVNENMEKENEYFQQTVVDQLVMQQVSPTQMVRSAGDAADSQAGGPQGG